MATGAGYVAAAAKSMGALPIGLDFSGAQVELAQKTCPGIKFVQGDAEKLPFDDEAFDAERRNPMWTTAPRSIRREHIPNAKDSSPEEFVAIVTWSMVLDMIVLHP